MTAKVILITGASSGIGYAAAVAFASRGDHVVALARRAERLAELTTVIATLPEPHGEILTMAADVRDPAALQSAVDQAVARFGRLDVLIANAGVGQRGDLCDAAWDDLETLLRTNIDGVLHSIRAAVPALRQTHGQIVLISSVSARLTAPYAAAYSASKAFVSSIGRALRFELAADGIAVTEMLIGRTATEFSAKRLGQTGHATRAPRLPNMTADRVAAAILRAVDRRQRTVVLRLFDRLILWASVIAPDMIARQAQRQYR
ncbi:MAG: SDR family NAD(P)-dependent oxidoreductase [Chloroflexi bacterium]|nr:SDR family NAD(P)-dependent oxidoreductase [Chloroflexota bacterium]